MGKAIFIVQDVVDSSTEQKTVIALKYDTISTTITPYEIMEHNVLFATLNGSGLMINGYSIKVNENGYTSYDNIAGISDFFYDWNDDKVYVIVLKKFNPSSFAVVPLVGVNNSGSVGWIRIQNFSLSDYQILSFGLIPKTNKNNVYYGFIKVQKENTLTHTIQNKIKTFFSFQYANLVAEAIYMNNFSFSVSYFTLNKKYNNDAFSADNEDLVNKLLDDLKYMTHNGNPYPTYVKTNNLVIDEKNNTLKGNVFFVVDNWWNYEKSTISRNIDFDFKKHNGFGDVMIYSIMIVLFFAVSATILILIHNKKSTNRKIINSKK